RTPLAEQVGAVSLIGRGLERRPEDLDLLADLLAPRTGEELQAAAVATLGRLGDPRSPHAPIRGWEGHTPGLRSAVFAVLLRPGGGPSVILDALADRRILPQDVPLTARQRLLGDASPDIRRRAGRSFTDAVDPDRNKVVSAYGPAMHLL